MNQKTTYFQIGSQIVGNYLLTQRQYAEGHEIAIHTWSHNDLTTLSSEQVYAELAWCIYAIHSAIGQTPKLFRPPYGSINDNVRQVAAQLGLTVITLSQSVANRRLSFGAQTQTTGKFPLPPTRTKTLSIPLLDSSSLGLPPFSLNMNLRPILSKVVKIFRK